MTFDQFQSGSVFTYSYLWSHQAQRGETSGRKERPVVVGFRLRQKRGLDKLIILPIASKCPDTARFASEIPVAEKRRAGLDPKLDLWIILDDANSDVLGKSFYFRNQNPIGRFSKAYFFPLIQELIARRDQIKLSDRTR